MMRKLRYKINCYTRTISLVITSLLLLVVISTGCNYYHTSQMSKTKKLLLDKYEKV